MKVFALLCALTSTSAFSGSYSDAITVSDTEIKITQAAHDHIASEGLMTVMYQAASDPVVDQDGDQIGYMLSQIVEGSVYETIGLQNGDIVLEIEGQTLADPKRSVDLLRYAKGLEEFTFTMMRAGVRKTVTVLVK